MTNMIIHIDPERFDAAWNEETGEYDVQLTDAEIYEAHKEYERRQDDNLPDYDAHIAEQERIAYEVSDAADRERDEGVYDHIDDIILYPRK